MTITAGDSPGGDPHEGAKVRPRQEAVSPPEAQATGTAALGGPIAGLAGTAATGDRAATLRALRDHLATSIETCESARDVASLSARLLDTLDKIAALPVPAKGTALDELAARRAAPADGVPRSALGRQRR